MWLVFKTVKNCTYLRCNYSLCKNIRSSLTQMDLVPVWCVSYYVPKFKPLYNTRNATFAWHFPYHASVEVSTVRLGITC